MQLWTCLVFILMCTDVFKTSSLRNPPLLQGFKLEVETVTCASLYLAIVESGTCPLEKFLSLKIWDFTFSDKRVQLTHLKLMEV